jgi:hypothetical protein
VPGPQFPLYVLGRQMVQAHPCAPIGGNVRIAIAIFSYLGRFSFGITADSSAAADLGILARGIRRGLAELQDLSGARRGLPPERRTRRPAPHRPDLRAVCPGWPGVTGEIFPAAFPLGHPDDAASGWSWPSRGR